MHISWLGLSALRVETKGAVIVTDPFAPTLTTRPLRAKADVVTVSNPASEAHNHVGAIHGSPFVVDTPGEFEVKGVYMQGLAGSHSTLYTFDVEGLRLAHIGDLRAAPQSAVLERMNGVDVLCLPVGGGTTLDPEAAMEVVNAIEPRIVIPMHYHVEGFKPKEKLLPVAAFLREIGASKVEPIERLTVKKRDLGEDETTVVVLHP